MALKELRAIGPSALVPNMAELVQLVEGQHDEVSQSSNAWELLQRLFPLFAQTNAVTGLTTARQLLRSNEHANRIKGLEVAENIVAEPSGLALASCDEDLLQVATKAAKSPGDCGPRFKVLIELLEEGTNKRKDTEGAVERDAKKRKSS